MKLIYIFSAVILATWLWIWLENNLTNTPSLENTWSTQTESSWMIISTIVTNTGETIVSTWQILQTEQSSSWVTEEKVEHIKRPKKVNSLYFTWYAAATKSKITNLYNIAKNSSVNSVTIDIKEVSGYTSFDFPDYTFWKIKPESYDAISDIKKTIKELHEKWIYVIWRIVVFKDKYLAWKRPDLAIKWSYDTKSAWTDYNWNKYLDPHSKEVWDYIVDLSLASYELWFDEINYDYVRFPTDWYISKTYYPFSSSILSKNSKWWKTMVIDEFWNYITTKIKEKNSDITLSADIFWLVTNKDLFEIWQNLESFVLNFDYVWPMVYPSHYSVWYLWYQVPDNIPYKVIKDAMNNTNNRIDKLNSDIIQANMSWTTLLIQNWYTPKADITNIWEIPKTKIMPWLQWFTCTRCKWATAYNSTKFNEEVSAVNDSWLESWWVWNSASNYYPERY